MITSAALLLGSLLPGQKPAASASYYVAHGYFGFGETVGRAGDANQDGVPDLVLGDGGFEGDIPPAFWIVSGLDGSVLHYIPLTLGTAPTCRVIDGGADLDGDGVPDVLVEAHDLTNLAPTRYVISGKTGSLSSVIASEGGKQSMGYGARIVRDFDGDGLADIGVIDHAGNERHGALRFYSGKTGAPLGSLAVNSNSGRSWLGFLDLEPSGNDGIRKFALVTWVSIELHASSVRTETAATTEVWRLDDRRAGDRRFGRLASLGDFDGDGVRDLAVSFHDAVDMVDGRTGCLLFHFEPKTRRDSWMCFGWALAPLGDINGDGIDDLAISETESGALNGSIHAMSGKSGRELWETATLSDMSLHHFGSELAAVGDIDADGILDLVVGTDEVASKEPGLACVISGKTGTELYRFRRSGDTTLEVTRRFPLRTKPR